MKPSENIIKQIKTFEEISRGPAIEILKSYPSKDKYKDQFEVENQNDYFDVKSA